MIAATPPSPEFEIDGSGEILARLGEEPLELLRFPGLVRDDGAIDGGAAPPGEETRLLAGTFFHQHHDVLFRLCQPLRVVVHEPGEDVLAEQRVDGEARFRQERIGRLCGGNSRDERQE